MSSHHDLRIGVGDLLGRPGSQRAVERDVPSEALTVGTASVEAGTPITVDLIVESTAVAGTVTVVGTLTFQWSGECRRCLQPVQGMLEATVHEVFARTPIDDEIWPLDGEEIDIGAVVREGVLLALPLAPLCGENCRGPAPEEFPALTGEAADGEGDDRGDDEDADGGSPPTDPRWAALDELRFD